MNLIKEIWKFISSSLKGIKMGGTLKQLGLFLSKDEIPVYWWNGDGNKNFGDLIGPYLVEKISGRKPVWVNPKYCFRKHYFVAGSILWSARRNSVIWGSGIISREEKINKPKKIFAVRGPLTRKRLLDLGYFCPEVYGDPGLLLPLFYQPKIKKKYKLGVIPHYVDYKKIKKMASKNILVINLLDPVEKVIDDICLCKRTISSSLHGLITSHAYGIPSVWVEFSDKLIGDRTKFKDYFLSIGIKENPPLNLKEMNLNYKELIKLIDKKHNNKIKFDRKKLLSACPFKINFT